MALAPPAFALAFASFALAPPALAVAVAFWLLAFAACGPGTGGVFAAGAVGEVGGVVARPPPRACFSSALSSALIAASIAARVVGVAPPRS